MKDIIVRIAPSPTGFLHLGTVRAMLFNYLFAKRHKGKFVFRWEDTDKERSKREFEDEIIVGVRWLGLDFDEQHRQSEYEEMHRDQMRELWEKEKVFPCFVTPEELQAGREQAQKEKKNFVFWSPYRDMSRDELETKMKSGEKFVWRLRVNPNETVKFEDMVKGEVEVDTNTLGDFAIARSDGSVLFMLANVIDDHAQNISHVIRGDDHLPNTPKQILLYRALGFFTPKFAHIPLVLDRQKRKLSKRRVEPGTAILIQDFIKMGFVPEGVINGLAFLGWNPKTHDEIFSLEDLGKIFDIHHVNPAGAQYDFEKMKWFNTHWLRKLPTEKIIEHLQTWTKHNKKTLPDDRYKLGRCIDFIVPKVKNLVELYDELEYFFGEPELDRDMIIGKNTLEETRKMLEAIKEMLEQIREKDWSASFIREQAIKKIEALGCGNGPFLNPYRVALSGRAKSVGPFEISEIIDKPQALHRIIRAQDLLS